MEICTQQVRGEAQEASEYVSLRRGHQTQFNAAARPSASCRTQDLEAGPYSYSEALKTSETVSNTTNEQVEGKSADGFKNADTQNYENLNGMADKLLAERFANSPEKAGNSSGKIGRHNLQFISNPSLMTSVNSLLTSLDEIRSRQANLVQSVREQLGKGQNERKQVDQENLDPKNLSPKAMVAAAKARLNNVRPSWLDDEDLEDQENDEEAVEVELDEFEDADPEQPCGDAESTDSLDSSEDIIPSRDGGSLEKVSNLHDEHVEITDVIDFSREAQFNFGNLLPGQILEDDLELRNCSKQPVVLKISAICHNSEFDSLEEYVFSMRKNTAFEYNDQYYIMLSPGTSLAMKIAIKAPLNKSAKGGFALGGDIVIAFKDRPESQKVYSIEAKVQMPKVTLGRELFIPPLPFPVLKIAYKRGKKADFKIPIKNSSHFPVQLEYELLHDETLEEVSADVLDVFTSPLTTTLPANGTGLVTMLVKPITTNMGGERQNIKKMLLAKVKGSSLIYQFVLWIEVYG